MADIPTYAEQVAFMRALADDLPPDMRDMVLARFEMGREQYGDAWFTRDNLAEGYPEIADTWNYIAYAIMTEQVTAAESQRTRNAVAVAWLFLESLREKAGVPNGD